MKLNGVAPEFLPLVAAVDLEMTRVYVVYCFQRIISPDISVSTGFDDSHWIPQYLYA